MEPPSSAECLVRFRDFPSSTPVLRTK